VVILSNPEVTGVAEALEL